MRRAILWLILVAAMVSLVVAALVTLPQSTRDRREIPPLIATLPDFAFLNLDGSTVSKADLAGAPWVADFIFTRCLLSCPRMTQKMMELETLLPAGSSVHRVSFSVDPNYDRPEIFRAYAESWGIVDPDWLFLTGEREAMYSLILNGFGLAVEDAPASGSTSAEEPILHSTRFVLVDAAGGIRGYYDVAEPGQLEALTADLVALTGSP